MNRKIISARQMLLTSRRWFAKPPETHQMPGLSMMSWAAFAVQYKRHADAENWLGQWLKAIGMTPPSTKNREHMGPAISYMATLFSCEAWLNNNGPTVFVEAETAYLANRTDAMESVKTNEIKIALPYVYFCLPKSQAMNWNGRLYCDCIVSVQRGKIKTLNVGDSNLGVNDRWPLEATAEMDNVHYMEVTWFGSEQVDEPFTTLFSLDQDISIAKEMQNQMDVEEKFGYMPKGMSGEMYLSFVGMTVNLLLMMQSYPRYLDRQAENRPYKMLPKEGREPEPQVFVLAASKHRNLFQVVQEQMQQDANRTHDSPHVHWRRGHWRRQRHGDQWEVENEGAQALVSPEGFRSHMRWIMPVLVNAGADQNSDTQEVETVS